MADVGTVRGSMQEAHYAIENARDWLDGDGFSEKEADGIEEDIAQAITYLGIALGEVKRLRAEGLDEPEEDIVPDLSLVLVADDPGVVEEDG